MKEDCTIYSLENCMTRKQRLKWKKDYRRTLNYIKKYEKRCKKNIYFFEKASGEARIRVINRTNKRRRKQYKIKNVHGSIVTILYSHMTIK